jgi:hypothetical protein
LGQLPVSEESGISDQNKKDLSDALKNDLPVPLPSDGSSDIVVAASCTAHNSCSMSSCSSCSTTYLSVTFERLAVSAAATDREQPSGSRVLRQRNHSDGGGGVRRRTNSRRQQLPPSSLLRPSKLTAVNKQLLPYTSTLPENENLPVSAATVTAAAAAGGVTLRDKERRCEINEAAVTTTGAAAAAVFGGDFSAAFENFASLSLDGSKAAAASTADKIFASGAGYRSPSVGILNFCIVLVLKATPVFFCYKFCFLLYLVQLKHVRLPVLVPFS